MKKVVPMKKYRRAMNTLDLNIRLKNLNKILKIKDKNFYLRRLICCIPLANTHGNTIGHYIAYC